MKISHSKNIVIFFGQTWDSGCFSVLKFFPRFLVGQYVTVHDEVISHVNVSSARAVDGGTYSCRAENAVGFAEHAARLNIYGEG